MRKIIASIYSFGVNKYIEKKVFQGSPVWHQLRWPRFSRQLIPIYKWIHAPSVMLPIMLAAIQNILDPVSARRGWNAVDDCCRT